MLRALCLVVVIVAVSPAHAADSKRLACNGALIEPSGLNPASKSLEMIIGSAKTVSLNLGQGVVDASVLSDNVVQLKFETKDFTGEFFHYTNDLFLIYDSNHLARLTCKQI